MLAMRVVQRRFRSIPIIFLRVTDNRMNQTFPPSGALRHGYIVIPFARVLPDILEIRFDGISVKDLVRLGICFSDDLQGLCVDDIPELILPFPSRLILSGKKYLFESDKKSCRQSPDSVLLICPVICSIVFSLIVS